MRRSRRLVLFAMLGRVVSIVAIASVVAMVSACDRPSDLPRKRDEVLASGRAYLHRFDDFKLRADDLDRRLRALPAATLQTAAIQHRLALVRTSVDQQRTYLQAVPRTVQDWIKAGDPRQVQRMHDGMRQRLDEAIVGIIDNLAAVESRTAIAEEQPGGPDQPAAQPVPEPTVEDRNPTEGAAPVR